MVKNDLVIEHAHIGFRNFSGRGSQYNPEGSRNFAVFIDDKEFADKIASEGWNVKQTKPRNEDDEPNIFLPVAVKMDSSYAPPKVWQITSRGKTLLTPTTIGTLDSAEIENVDLILNPYNWTYNKKTGTKAYLKSMYVTLKEDAFSDKYSNVPDAGTVPPKFDDDDTDIPF